MSRDTLFALLMATLVGSSCAGSFYLVAKGNTARYDAFMKPCLQDHKQYECDVLWNQAR